jgi:hypothetical protein
VIAGMRELEDARASFFAGHGDVVNGAISLTAGAAAQKLLELAADRIAVTADLRSDDRLALSVHNGTTVALESVRDLDGTVTTAPLEADTETTILLPGVGTHRLHLQALPSGEEPARVVTVIVTSDGSSVVGHAFAGAV